MDIELKEFIKTSDAIEKTEELLAEISKKFTKLTEDLSTASLDQESFKQIDDRFKALEKTLKQEMNSQIQKAKNDLDAKLKEEVARLNTKIDGIAQAISSLPQNKPRSQNNKGGGQNKDFQPRDHAKTQQSFKGNFNGPKANSVEKENKQ